MQTGSSESIRNDGSASKRNCTYDYIYKAKEKISENQFWKAVKVYMNKPHVVNRALCDVEDKWLGISEHSVNLANIENIFKESENATESSIIDKVTSLGLVKGSEETAEQIFWDSIVGHKSHVFGIVRKAIPKNVLAMQQIELIILDTGNNTATFVSEPVENGPKILPELPYTLSLTSEGIKLSLPSSEQNITCFFWLQNKLLPRIGKWAEESLNDQPTQFASGSLTQINIQAFNELYQMLKRKYSKQLIDNWSESTDPLKFVFEDISIAAYLITLWRAEQTERNLERKQSFLDIGCGNGLLVFILSSEGYPGTGFDIRKRKIWDTYPDHVILKEKTVDPCSGELFAEYDWLIGNHSDELTPWMPVMAAKASYNTRFFVLPCCAFDFYAKFQKKSNSASLYAEFLDFVLEVTQVCQFDAVVDKLRIPSTKRTAIIGLSRKYSEKDWSSVKLSIDDFIQTRSRSSSTAVVFKARAAHEPIRNCTHINETVKLDMVNAVVGLLLNKAMYIKIVKDGSTVDWNKGSCLTLKDIATALSYTQLQNLKKGCGGLQTFLRNHAHVFLIKNAAVSLKVPSILILSNKATECLRTKECWFFLSHPQGCTLTTEECSYKH